MVDRTAEVLVIGGGLAGAATAAHLARAGRSVVVLERDAEPTHKVCGEFLGRAACQELEGLGVDLEALGARWIEHCTLFSGDRSAQAPLPFRAAGLSRRTLDPALRDHAAWAGADIRLGVRSTAVRGGQVDLANGESLSANAIVIATGKHEVRGLTRRSVLKRKDAKIGIKEHLSLTPSAMADLGNSVELHFFEGGYAGLMPTGDGVANLSIAMDPAVWRARELTPATYRDWLQRYVPSLQDRLTGARSLFPKPLTVSAVPYGYRLWSAPDDEPSLWRVGEQAIVTPSLTGEGMSLALGSARCLGECLLAGRSQTEYRQSLRRHFNRQILAARSFEALLEGSMTRGGIMRLLAVLPSALGVAARLTRSA